MSERSPMFPLGSVLLPTMMLPLHIFEDRYRAMIRDVLDGDQTFGVTLIERGSEVGGNDIRTMVGCRARVLEAEEQLDGRWHVLAVGTDRVAVDEWLPDDPYPVAMLTELPDERADEPTTAVDDTRWLELDSAFRDLLRLAKSKGSPVHPEVELSDDPAIATFQMAAVAPLGALDRHSVLKAIGAERRRLVLLAAFEDATVLVNDSPSS